MINRDFRIKNDFQKSAIYRSLKSDLIADFGVKSLSRSVCTLAVHRFVMRTQTLINSADEHMKYTFLKIKFLIGCFLFAF